MTRPGYTQPTGPAGLPTGNPWDLAYPFGQAPPALDRRGEHREDDGPGYIGQQADDVEATEPEPDEPAEDTEDTEDARRPARKRAAAKNAPASRGKAAKKETDR